MEKTKKVSTKCLGKSLHHTTVLQNFRTLNRKDLVLKELRNRTTSKFTSVTLHFPSQEGTGKFAQICSKTVE